MGSLDGRVAIVTGAGRGIGRSVALLLASEGMSVVVNDLGGALDGSGSDSGPAREVAEAIAGSGGRAVASGADESAQNRIINFTSVSGLHGAPGQPNYAAAKMGIVGLTYSAANSLAKYGVTVNAVSPGAATSYSRTAPVSESASTPREAWSYPSAWAADIAVTSRAVAMPRFRPAARVPTRAMCMSRCPVALWWASCSRLISMPSGSDP